MKKTMLAAAVAMTATPAFAQVLGPPQFETAYSSRGQCESALAHERNSQRKDPATRGAGYEDLSGSEFNQASRFTTRCEQTDEGTYQVVYSVDGFDDIEE